jgi:8-oxo-dGTP diphosphatase
MMGPQIAGGVLTDSRGVLMAHRRPDREHAPDTWSFAGGHVDPGETPAEALRRELREELGVEAVVEGEPHLRVVEGEGPDAVVFSMWIVRQWTGTPVNAAPEEHDELRWVRSADLDELALAHGFCRTLVEELSGA